MTRLFQTPDGLIYPVVILTGFRRHVAIKFLGLRKTGLLLLSGFYLVRASTPMQCYRPRHVERLIIQGLGLGHTGGIHPA